MTIYLSFWFWFWFSSSFWLLFGVFFVGFFLAGFGLGEEGGEDDDEEDASAQALEREHKAHFDADKVDEADEQRPAEAAAADGVGNDFADDEEDYQQFGGDEYPRRGGVACKEGHGDGQRADEHNEDLGFPLFPGLVVGVVSLDRELCDNLHQGRQDAIDDVGEEEEHQQRQRPADDGGHTEPSDEGPRVDVVPHFVFGEGALEAVVAAGQHGDAEERVEQRIEA